MSAKHSAKSPRAKKNAQPVTEVKPPAPKHIPKVTIHPRNPNQKLYLDLINGRELTFGLGPAGTGKTYIACALAAQALCKDSFTKIIIVRPCLEVFGERLGFLPGTLEDKAGPYLVPLIEALSELTTPEHVQQLKLSGRIELATLAHMRGRTLKNAFIILDEAQNTTVEQMIMIVTRLGEGSKMVINGDLSQVDLPPRTKSGLEFAREVYGSVEEVGWVTFSSGDITRHPLVSKLVKAHEGWNLSRKAVPAR